MSEHDPLCFLAQFPGKAAQAVGPDACTCAIIRAARDDQRGFDIRQQVEERDAFRAKVEALRAAGRTRDWDYYAALDDVLALLDGSDG